MSLSTPSIPVPILFDFEWDSYLHLCARTQPPSYMLTKGSHWPEESRETHMKVEFQDGARSRILSVKDKNIVVLSRKSVVTISFSNKTQTDTFRFTGERIDRLFQEQRDLTSWRRMTHPKLIFYISRDETTKTKYRASVAVDAEQESCCSALARFLSPSAVQLCLSSKKM